METMETKIRDGVRQIMNLQEELSSKREKILVEREKNRLSAKEVRNRRQETVDAETYYMNELRKASSESLEFDPKKLLEAYGKVLERREGLSIFEDNYLQEEKELVSMEWSFAEIESDFYQFTLKDRFDELIEMISSFKHKEPAYMSQDTKASIVQHTMPPPPPPPPPPPLLQPSAQPYVLSLPFRPDDHTSMDKESVKASPVAELLRLVDAQDGHSFEDDNCVLSWDHVSNMSEARLMRLRNDFENLRNEQIARTGDIEVETLEFDEDKGADLDDSSFKERYLGVIGAMTAEEVNIHKLREKMMCQELKNSLSRRGSANTAPDLRDNQPCFDLISIAYTDSAVSTLSKDPTVQQRVETWLRQYRQDNFIERTIRKEIMNNPRKERSFDDIRYEPSVPGIPFSRTPLSERQQFNDSVAHTEIDSTQAQPLTRYEGNQKSLSSIFGDRIAGMERPRAIEGRQFQFSSSSFLSTEMRANQLERSSGDPTAGKASPAETRDDRRQTSEPGFLQVAESTGSSHHHLQNQSWVYSSSRPREDNLCSNHRAQGFPLQQNIRSIEHCEPKAQVQGTTSPGHPFENAISKKGSKFLSSVFTLDSKSDTKRSSTRCDSQVGLRLSIRPLSRAASARESRGHVKRLTSLLRLRRHDSSLSTPE